MKKIIKDKDIHAPLKGNPAMRKAIWNSVEDLDLQITEIEVSNALRNLRFIFLFAAAFYGILGLVFASLYFLIRVNKIHSFGKPYFYPLTPFDKTYFFKTAIKWPIRKEVKRSSMLTKTNKTKQGENL